MKLKSILNSSKDLKKNGYRIPNEYQNWWGMAMKLLANIVVIVLNYILSVGAGRSRPYFVGSI